MPHKPLPPEDLAHVLAHTREVFTSLRNARIFITGGTGFFGHWLLESLLHANRGLALNIRATVLTRDAAAFAARSPHITADAAITLLEGDIRTFPFPSHPHSHIIHAATDTVTDSQDLADSILAGTRRVLAFAQQTGARRLLYTSSGAVYGRGITDVTRIPETYPAAPLPPNSYDDAKRQAEQLCLSAPLETTIARCFAFVGPHLPLDAHFAIGNFIRDTLAGDPIHIKGDGTPLRSFLYMSDLAIWLWTMLATAPAGRAYNVGSDESVSIGQLAHVVRENVVPQEHVILSKAKDLLPARSAIKIDGTPTKDLSSRPERSEVERPAVRIDGTPIPNTAPATYVPDITRAQTELGLRATIPLREAIRRTAAWHSPKN